MKRILIISALLVFTSCASNKNTKPSETPTAPIVVEPSLPSAPVEAVALQITMVAATSKAAGYKFKDRGLTPMGYLKGMALVYARNYCQPHTVISEPLGASDKDALAYYGIKASNRNAFAFLFGLGMRESSGKYCEGRDMSAKNTSANSAEAGMFQTSYDSVGASPALKDLMSEYHDNCFLEVFKEKVTCSNSNNTIYGSGAGAAFQKMARQCPAFAAEYAAITIRKLRKHYGPINRKEVEFRQEVVNMLESIEKVVDANPSVCTAL